MHESKGGLHIPTLVRFLYKLYFHICREVSVTRRCYHRRAADRHTLHHLPSPSPSPSRSRSPPSFRYHRRAADRHPARSRTVRVAAGVREGRRRRGRQGGAVGRSTHLPLRGEYSPPTLRDPRAFPSHLLRRCRRWLGIGWPTPVGRAMAEESS